ncbi:MAG: 30S ribosomal protein S16 [Deltaproteobacteria bacterium]|nr:MAG: 30S ribosomal protein S16 [Deltaproteobacteria bacterium]
MAVRIRLQRHGKKKRPFYRIVAADQRAPRDGRYSELLGTYDPNHHPVVFSINDERYAHWLSVGASPSDTVASLMRKYRNGLTVSPEEMLRSSREGLAERRRAAANRAAAREVKPEAQEAPAEAAPAAEAPAAEAAAEAPAAEDKAETPAADA